MNNVVKIKRADYLFNSGIRKELLDIVLTSGAISYDGFEVLEDKHKRRDYAARVKKLIEEGLLEEIRVDNRKLYRLTSSGHEIISDMYGGLPYYDEIGEAYASELSKDHRRKRREKLMAETVMIMFAARICTTHDEKPNTIYDYHIPSVGAFFYTAREIKAGVVFSPSNIKNAYTREVKKYNSTFFGLLTSDGGSYVVYNTGKEKTSWSSVLEGSASFRIREFIYQFKDGVTVIPKSVNCIILYNKDSSLIDMFFKQKTKKEKNMINGVDKDVFKNSYFLPFNVYGKRMIEIMTIESWKEKLISGYLKKYDRKTRDLNIDCDAVKRNEEGEIEGFILLFAIPDLRKAHRFMQGALNQRKNEKEKNSRKREFWIVFYQHQRALVEGITSWCENVVTLVPLKSELTNDIVQKIKDM